MRELKALASRPLRIVDVGARAGIHPRWRALGGSFPLEVIGFEADKVECAALNSRAAAGVRFLPYALSSKAETRVLHLLASAASSSLHPPNEAFISRTVVQPGYRLEREVALSTQSLDVALEKEGVSDVDFMKIDTEGCELEILKGAPGMLRDVFALELEVWFNPVFTGAPVFREVDEFVSSAGFTLLDLARSNCFFKRKEGAALGGPKGQLVAGDALYFRDPASLPADSQFFERDKLVRSVVVLIQYAYYDLAMEFVAVAEGKGRLAEGDAAAIRCCIRREGRRSMFDFPGKHSLEKLVKKTGRWLTKFEGDYLGNW